MAFKFVGQEGSVENVIYMVTRILLCHRIEV